MALEELEQAGKWRWRNLPLPESHLAILGAGLLLHLAKPQPPRAKWPLSRAAGLSLIASGLALAAWATKSAGDTDLADPDSLVASGPYSISRHPMYLGWTSLYLGAALVTRSRWLMRLLPVLLILVRGSAIREERRLTDRFGSEYRAYGRMVHRYL